MGNIKNERIGEVNYNRYGSRMTIVEYNDKNNIKVKFDDGYIIKTYYELFKKGSVSNPYDKTLCGIGYIGEGKYKTCINSKHTKYYKCWQHMIDRCYSEKNLTARPTYRGCEVAKEWLNFQNFAQWYEENYYEVDGETMSLDKDILVKHNRIYSGETCIFVPKRINNIFEERYNIGHNNIRGIEYNKRLNTYKVTCYFKDRKKVILRFKTLEEAFNAYKDYKENYLKEIANSYKNKIPDKLYKALYNYKIEITDK